MSKKEKNKSVDETQKIINEIPDYNRQIQTAFKKTESDSKLEENIAERVKLRRQKSEKKEFVTIFYSRLRRSKKNIDMNQFKNVFNYETPDKMLKYLHSLKTITIIKQHPLLKKVLQILKIWLKICQKVMRKNKRTKMSNIVDKILEFALKE